MLPGKMSSAYSDDGQRHRIRRVDDLHAPTNEPPIIEPDTGVSITAELSEHRVRNERPEEEDEPIQE